MCVCTCEVHMFCASASSCPTAYKLSAAIMEEGPHCVKDKGAACHQWEITVIYERLSEQRQLNIPCVCVFLCAQVCGGGELITILQMEPLVTNKHYRYIWIARIQDLV